VKRFLTVLLCIIPLAAQAASIRELYYAHPARHDQNGKFQTWVDRRDLLVLHHPWEKSAADASVTAECDVEVPAEWSGRARLHFYMTDDYDGQAKPLSEGWLGQVNLVGHRFKQVLVNDAVIWEQDVADAEGASEPSRLSVLLPDTVRPGDRVRIGFRLIDRVGTATRLPGDHRYVGTTDNIQDTDPWKFMTHVYVGDIKLTPEAVETIPSSELPTAAKARAFHADNWPLTPWSDQVRFPVTLSVHGGETGGEQPLRCGVPLPPGAVHHVGQVVLTDEKGTPLPLQVTPMNHWPDGSLRWVEVNTIVPDGAGSARLDVLAEPAALSGPVPESPVSVIATGPGKVQIKTGQIEIVVAPFEDVLIPVLRNGNTLLENLAGRVEMDGRTYSPRVESVKVLAEGPIRGEIELSGELESGTDSLGRFVFRLAAFAGQPHLRMTWRIFNDRPETLNIARLELTAQCPWQPEATTAWGNQDKHAQGQVTLQQLKEKNFEVLDASGQILDSGEASEGWLGLTSDDKALCVLVRHFREQFPKALAVENGTLRIALFAPSDEEPCYTPHEGEAKRHEVWLGLWNAGLDHAGLERFAQSCARPPRLFDSDYFCATGALGPAYPHDDTRFADLTAFMKKTYGDIEAHRFYRNGIRHWGDAVYNAEQKQWRNGYYDQQQGMAVEYLMTGEPRWFEHLEATVRHIIDIDVCHSSVAHPDWVGGIHGYYGRDHSTEAPWNPMQRTKGTLAYWRLTADTDVRDAALAVADSAIAANRGIGASSVRDHAGILYCLTAAYDETHDPKYLEGARRVAHDAMGRIDARRGCYAEVHGNLSYRGNVPWMVAQLAEPMYDYYRQSGDIDAAIAVLGMAESIITENCTRGAPGDVFGYSHNPHFKKTSNYHILIAPAIMYAYELTGDPEFLTQARGMYAQTIREETVNSIVNCYWNTHTLLHYLNRYGSEETTP
jgi:PcRGLX-like N-terminal RIFT barrel domain